MWNLLYFVAFVGVFLPTINAQDEGMEKMQKCPCANEVIEGFLDSVAKNTLDIENGQRLRLRLWQLKEDDCQVNVVDESPKPGRIEITMVYQGDVDILQPGEGEDQYGSDDNKEPQGSMDMGQQQGGVDFGQQQVDGSIEPQQGENVGQQPGAGDNGISDEDIEQVLGSIDLDELQKSLEDAQLQQGADTAQEQAGADIAQEQAGADIAQEQAGINTAQEQAGINTAQEQAGAGAAQEQSELPNGSYSGTGGDKTMFSFLVDVNTGNLSESVDSIPAAQRKKRDLMPLGSVAINIGVAFDKTDSDVATRNDLSKSVLRKSLGDYWIALTDCLLDVEQ